MFSFKYLIDAPIIDIKQFPQLEGNANGDDGNYPHIASPDVVIDEDSQQIRLYYHGRLTDGRQATRVAISRDGLNFVAQPGSWDLKPKSIDQKNRGKEVIRR